MSFSQALSWQCTYQVIVDPLPCLYRYEDGSHSHSTIKLMFYYEHTIISYPREPSLISCGREVYVLRAICKELMVELLHSVCVLTL